MKSAGEAHEAVSHYCSHKSSLRLCGTRQTFHCSGGYSQRAKVLSCSLVPHIPQANLGVTIRQTSVLVKETLAVLSQCCAW